MKTLILLTSLFIFTNFTCSQGKNNFAPNEKDIVVGGGCEDCEALHESPIPLNELSHIDTLPDWNGEGPKIEISGVVYQNDGVTPAGDIILYIHHTDQTGHYPKKGDETGMGKRHGYLRGWMKTNEKGEYKFYTLRPAAYPNASFPAHIHLYIKEPGIASYWTDDYVFDDDDLVDERYRRESTNRAGDGILKLTKNENDVYTAKRDLVLGRNISNYPKK